MRKKKPRTFEIRRALRCGPFLDTSRLARCAYRCGLDPQYVEYLWSYGFYQYTHWRGFDREEGTCYRVSGATQACFDRLETFSLL
jgi:hypothetical protein